MPKPQSFTDSDLTAMGHHIAESLLTADLDQLPLWQHGAGAGFYRWLDTSGCLSEHEHAPEVRDMWRQALAYAEARGLISRHWTASHAVRINRTPVPPPPSFRRAAS